MLLLLRVFAASLASLLSLLVRVVATRRLARAAHCTMSNLGSGSRLLALLEDLWCGLLQLEVGFAQHLSGVESPFVAVFLCILPAVFGV